MKIGRRWIWVIAALVLVAVILPIPIAERYTSPTQDGKYTTNPLLAYRFVVAAVLVSPSSELNTSGEALAKAKDLFAGEPVQATKVELLYLPGDDDYSYTTMEGEELFVESPDGFVWEVWGYQGEAVTDGTGEGNAETTSPSDDEPLDVIALLDYSSGEPLATVTLDPRGDPAGG